MAAPTKSILLGKKYAGVEIFSVNSEDKIAVLATQRKKEEIIITSGYFVNSIDELVTEKLKLPILLVLNNSHVLQKEVPGTDPNDKKLLHKGFPNLQSDDFYYEIWRRRDSSILAICRKNYVDDLIISLSKCLKIASVSLGVTPIANLTSFEIPSLINTNTQTISLDSENCILPITSQGESYDINGLAIPSGHILGFSAILTFILPEATTGSILGLNAQLLDSFKQKAFFEKVTKAGIGFIVGILLINFFFFTHYFDKANQTNEIIAFNRAGIQNIIKIKDRIKEKEAALKGYTTSISLRSSLLINEIAKSVPSTLSLIEINYNPLEKKVKTEQTITTQDKIIIISGASSNNSDFTKWIDQLERLKQVSAVTILSFVKDAEAQSEFSVKIDIK